MNTQIYKNGVVSYSADLGTFEAIQTSVAKSDVCTFESNVIGLPLSECKASISPVQSGSGDPYPAGGGKNKLNCTATTVTQDGVTFTVNADGTIATSNTATTTTVFTVGSFNVTNGTTYTLNGLPADGSNTTFGFQIRRGNTALDNKYSASGNNYTATADETLTVVIVIRSGFNASGMLFKPMIRLSTVTDGTFAPYSNIRPISGWDSVKVSATGVNLWNEEWEKNAAYNNQGQKVVWANAIRNLSPIYVSPNTSYYLKFGTTNTVYVYWYDENMDFISIETCGSPKVITSPSNARYMNFNTNANYGTTYNNDISINYPSTDTAYHAYNGQTATIALPHTVYGAEHDVLSGVGSEPVYCVTLNVNTTHTFKKNSNNNGVGIFVLSNLSLPAGKENAVASDFICDKLKGNNSSSIYNYSGANSIGLTTQGTQIYVTADNAHQTSEDYDTWLTALGDIKLIYPLATPTTYQATPAQLQARNGVNNVWSDAGQTSLKYYEIYGYSLDGLFETSTPNLSLTQNSINATDFIET